MTATRKQLAQMMSPDLGPLSLCAVMIDGLHVGDHVVLAALRIDEPQKSRSSESTRERRK